MQLNTKVTLQQCLSSILSKPPMEREIISHPPLAINKTITYETAYAYLFHGVIRTPSSIVSRPSI